MKSSKKEETAISKNKKQRVLLGIFAASMILKILLLFGFFVYLYFWIKNR